MYTNEEKIQFSERLRAAITAVDPDVVKAAELATQFNLRHHKQPVTNAAAHKWLTAQAIPSIDKIETLANWLGVSNEWLRTGHEPTGKKHEHSELQKLMIEKFALLSIRQQRYIFEMVNDLQKKQSNSDI